MDRAPKKAPPTYSHIPAASEADPVIPGIRIVSSESHCDRNSWVFSIIPGEEDAAVNGLLDALDRMDEFLLSDRIHATDDLRGIYRKDGDRYAMMIHGQGWRGAWKTLDRGSAFSDARKRVGCNFGPPWSEYGSIRKGRPAVPGADPERDRGRKRPGMRDLLLRLKLILFP